MGVLEQVSQMKSQGIQEQEIISRLNQQKISPKEINDALNQSRIKDAVYSPKQTNTPPTYYADGSKGDWTMDASYLYVCVDASNWGRVLWELNW